VVAPIAAGMSSRGRNGVEWIPGDTLYGGEPTQDPRPSLGSRQPAATRKVLRKCDLEYRIAPKKLFEKAMPSRFTPEVVSMLEHIPNAFYALDKDFRFIYANRKIQQLLGMTEEALIGQNLWELFPAWVGTPIYNSFKQALNASEPITFESYSPLNRAWFEVRAFPSEYGLAIYANDISERKKAETRLQLLNKSGEILAREHDLSEALHRISKLIVPEFADWFTVDHLKEKEVAILLMANTDLENVKWGMEYRSRTKVDIEKPRPGSVGWVIRIGVPVLFNDVTDELIAGAASDEEHLEVLRRLDIKGSIIVPIPMRDKTIGALTFISSTPERRYDDSDLRFASDLAILIGLTIENRRMFDEMKKDLARKIKENSLKLTDS
jgi:PAS domain S-box-containing protein